MRLRALLVPLLAALAGCGKSTLVSRDTDAGSPADAGALDAGPGDAGPGDAGPGDAGPGDAGLDAGPADAGLDAGPEDAGPPPDAGCRPPRDPDAARRVVISKPFLPDAGRSDLYEVLELSPQGQLSATGVTFHMHPTFAGQIAFTPDGELGLVAQEDGTLGAFRLLGDGGVEVLNPGLGGFSARAVRVTADGTRAYVIDPDTLNNGGGLYEVPIACDGTLGAPVKRGTFNTPDALAFLNARPERLVLAGGAANGSDGGEDVHALDLQPGAAPALQGSGVAFPGHDAIPSAVAVTEDDAYALVADNGFLAGSRVAVVWLSPAGPVGVDVLVTANPADVVASPFGNAALVLNSDGQDGLTALDYDPANAAHPFSLRGRIAYAGPRPQLPAEAVVLRRGPLTGRVLVGELSGVRQVQFLPDAGVQDLSLLGTGEAFEDIVGALGVQP